MGKIEDSIELLLLRLKEEGKLKQKDVRDINQSIRAKIQRHARDKKQDKSENNLKDMKVEYNFQGVGK